MEVVCGKALRISCPGSNEAELGNGTKAIVRVCHSHLTPVDAALGPWEVDRYHIDVRYRPGLTIKRACRVYRNQAVQIRRIEA